MRTDRSHEVEVPVVVAARRAVCGDAVALDLRPISGAELPEWQAGSHIDVVLPNGLTRQYSLCGPVADRGRWVVAVRREVNGRGGSAYLVDEVREGDELIAVGPRNHFRLEEATSYRFLAGGIGITPIVAMVEEAQARAVPWTLTFCGRTRESMPFLPDLLQLHGDRVRVHVDETDGLLDLAAFMSNPAPGERLYACGPTGLLDAVQERSAAWPPESVHWERFAPVEVDAGPNKPFEVELELSGMTLAVPPERSILDVVTDAGVPVLSSCAEGTCGTCETRVVSGEIQHRDSVLSPEEQEEGEVMMICVSRATSSRLVLEL